MNCKDLMIGDWVNYSILNLNAKVFSTLGNHTIGIQFVDKNNKVEAIHGLLEEAINPIPLTESILVKNGWRKEPITIDGDYANWHGEIPISQAEDEYNYADIELRYVHALQHLLRLCGIDKELVID